MTVRVFGDVSRFDELTVEGTLESGLLAGYGANGRLVGALTVAASDELERLAKDMIARRAPTRALHADLVAAGTSR